MPQSGQKCEKWIGHGEKRNTMKEKNVKMSKTDITSETKRKKEHIRLTFTFKALFV